MDQHQPDLNITSTQFATVREPFNEALQRKVFFFINPKSGGNKGKELLLMECQNIKFSGYKSYFTNLFIQSQIDFTCDIILKSLKKNQIVTIFACGGDGTLPWVISVIAEHNIPFDSITFSTVPYGTGNDISIFLSTKTINDSCSDHLKQLKKVLEQIKLMKESYFDIWKVTIKVEEQGKIQKIKHENGKAVEYIIEEKTFESTMINYFGIGADAYVGYSFEPHRTKSTCCNKFWYAISGLKQTLCCYDKKIKDLVQEFREESSLETKLIFNDDMLQMNGKSFLALNINSYSAGTRDIWQNSMKKQAIVELNASQDQIKQGKEGKKQKQVQKQKSTSKDKQIEPKFDKQDSGDGKLEFVTFKNILNVGLEKIIKGRAYQITQGTGNFKILFKKNVITHILIDGEFYKTTFPEEVSIQKSPIVPGGKIRILSN